VTVSKVFRDSPQVEHIVRLALAEDIGTGDVTTDSVIPAGTMAVGRIVARRSGIIAGLPVAEIVFGLVDPDIIFEPHVKDGDSIVPDQIVALVSGPAASLLKSERTALNFLMRMSGIASSVASFVDALAGTGIKLLDTRKTTPGHRVLDKYAVVMGGGFNHRMSLAGGVLIKNNHISTCGGVEAAVRAARAGAPVTLKVEIEVRTSAEAVAAATAGADILLLDHMTPAQAKEVRRIVGDRILLEVSGNMTPQKALKYAGCGVDYVSSGSITYEAGWLDLSMYLDLGVCEGHVS
jgi:nicotinate-nucleotide pyrophosphorylase (carboxylating)